MEVDFFLDDENGKIRDAVRLLYASEKVKDHYDSPSPNVEQADHNGEFPIVELEALVRMKLNSYRLKDRIHLQDMIGIELIDQSWPARFSPDLAKRLQDILDDPDG